MALELKFNNYPPISVLSQFSKMLENLYGIRAGKSGLRNLLHFMEIVTKQVDKGLPDDVEYLDFSKAFEKVPHNRQINKMKTYGI